ncbi:hypothetical protein, partial [Thiolapillus sp.]
MTTIADLHRRRREIVETASVIDNLMTPEQLSVHAIAKVTHILLCDLCEMVTNHLADSHKELYPGLLTHSEPSVKNMAWGLINNDKLLKPEFSQYKRKWLKDQACLRPRDRFWDIPVPKIDSAFDNLFVPQPSWSPSTTQQLRKLVAAPYLSPNDWTPRLDAYFASPL